MRYPDGAYCVPVNAERKPKPGTDSLSRVAGDGRYGFGRKKGIGQRVTACRKRKRTSRLATNSQCRGDDFYVQLDRYKAMGPLVLKKRTPVVCKSCVGNFLH